MTRRQSSRGALHKSALAAAGMSMLALTACSGGTSAGSNPEDGGTLSVGIGPTGSGCIDPAQTANFNAMTVAKTGVDSLTDQDTETGEIVPWLAESWEVNDDATSFRFSLRDEVTFSDGTPFNAEAVKANLDYVYGLGPASGRGVIYLENYVETVVEDDLTAVVNFSAPSAYFLVGSSTLVFGMTSVASTQMSAEERCQGAWVGTGPFTLADWSAATGATATKRDDYVWPSALATNEGPATLDEIDFLVQDVPSVRAGSISSGQTQVGTQLEGQDLPGIEAGGAEVLVSKQPGLPGTFFANTMSSSLDSEEVRRAISIAIDRSTIVNTVLNDHYAPAYSVLTSNLQEWADMSGDLDYAPDDAAALLDAAGWEMGSDGVRERDGQELVVRLVYSTELGGFYSSIMELVQQELADVGVRVEIEPGTSAMTSEKITAFDFDLFYVTATESDPIISRGQLSKYTANNDGMFENLGLADLFDAAAATTDDQERASIYADIQQIVADSGIAIPLLEAVQIAGVAENVTGVRYDFKSVPLFHDAAFTG